MTEEPKREEPKKKEDVDISQEAVMSRMTLGGHLGGASVFGTVEPPAKKEEEPKHKK